MARKLSKQARVRYAKEAMAQEKWIAARNYDTYPNPAEVRAADQKYLHLLRRAAEFGERIWN